MSILFLPCISWVCCVTLSKWIIFTPPTKGNCLLQQSTCVLWIRQDINIVQNNCTLQRRKKRTGYVWRSKTTGLFLSAVWAALCQHRHHRHTRQKCEPWMIIITAVKTNVNQLSQTVDVFVILVPEDVCGARCVPIPMCALEQCSCESLMKRCRILNLWI